MRIGSRATERRITFNPQLRFGEAYMNGDISFEAGSLYDFLDVLMVNMAGNPAPLWLHIPDALRYITRRLHQFNPIGRAQRNVAHHYDLDGRLYELFLDGDRQYSCAYFEDANASLEEAQLAKKRHLAAKLALKDGQRVLDVGSGWGGLALYLAKCADVAVTGITLSEEQLSFSNDRKQRLGLGGRVDFNLQDYRTLVGKFDRIVSVGMFEHVGVVHYREFFEKIRDLLTDDGVAVIHSIGRFGGPSVTNAFIEKYIFPGGYIPAVSEVYPAIEKAGLLVTDMEILRLHYAETLKHWRERFLARWSEAAAIYDDRFCRMWEFYLAGSEVSFRREDKMVFQIQMSKSQTSLPLTRDYIFDWEQTRRVADAMGTTDRQLAGE